MFFYLSNETNADTGGQMLWSMHTPHRIHRITACIVWGQLSPWRPSFFRSIFQTDAGGNQFIVICGLLRRHHPDVAWVVARSDAPFCSRWNLMGAPPLLESIWHIKSWSFPLLYAIIFWPIQTNRTGLQDGLTIYPVPPIILEDKLYSL